MLNSCGICGNITTMCRCGDFRPSGDYVADLADAEALHKIALAKRDKRREKWDRRFLIMARHVSTWSKDPSTQVGAVIVRPDYTVASLGFNGFPRGVDDSPEHYEDRDQKYSQIVHAELNAILTAREPLHGYTLYTWPPALCPTCDRCAACVIQSGISRVVGVVTRTGHFAERWREMNERALKMYGQAGVEVTRVEHPGE